MNDHGAEALARLREIRDALGEDNAPRRINLRDYAEPGSSAWDAFVEVSGTPGHKVRRPTMLARINQAIDALTAQIAELQAASLAAQEQFQQELAARDRELQQLRMDLDLAQLDVELLGTVVDYSG